MFAVDDVVLLNQRQSFLVADLVAHQHENQRAIAPDFVGYIGDSRNARNLVASAQRPMKLLPAAREHAARKRHRRNESAALGMAIGAKFGLAMKRQKVQPVPQRRQRVAVARERVVAVERRGKRGHRSERDAILARFGFADPFAKVVDIHAGCRHFPPGSSRTLATPGSTRRPSCSQAARRSPRRPCAGRTRRSSRPLRNLASPPVRRRKYPNSRGAAQSWWPLASSSAITPAASAVFQVDVAAPKARVS